MRFTTSLRESSILLPQPWHFNPISAPRRTTSQSVLPQGCGFFIRITSSIIKSGNMNLFHTQYPVALRSQ